VQEVVERAAVGKLGRWGGAGTGTSD
jgi:hypothetical protein